jgi:cob(I)alamin adenosyltransferase
MKVYTGGGDRGKTSLFSGERVDKHHLRIESSGAVDELNSILGALINALPPQAAVEKQKELQRVQSNLLHLGARLATIPGSPLSSAIQEIRVTDSRFLETAIDSMQSDLPQLREFILPGGHAAAGWAHIARSVCRRAERRVVCLAGEDEKDSLEQLKGVIVFLNRLSDYLFVLARYCNAIAGVADVPWKK